MLLFLTDLKVKKSVVGVVFEYVSLFSVTARGAVSNSIPKQEMTSQVV